MMPRKLTCLEVKKIVQRFFDGGTMLSIGKEFDVSRQTIRNILTRIIYKECFEFKDFGYFSQSEWDEAVQKRLTQNQRLSRGRGVRGRK